MYYLRDGLSTGKMKSGGKSVVLSKTRLVQIKKIFLLSHRYDLKIKLAIHSTG